MAFVDDDADGPEVDGDFADFAGRQQVGLLETVAEFYALDAVEYGDFAAIGIDVDELGGEVGVDAGG